MHLDFPKMEFGRPIRAMLCGRENAWPAIRFAALLLATWPVWRWYVRRIMDGSDEPWGLLALATAAALALWRGGAAATEVAHHASSAPARRASREKQFVWPMVWLVVYIATFPFAPPLLRALLAMCAFGSLIGPRRGAAGVWGLLVLSLPIVATFQFYLGFPLRVLAAEASAFTLQLLGFAVTREGSLLYWAGETVMVDAPCSGIHMLWFGFYFAFLLAAFHRLNPARTLYCASGTLVIVVIANMARATALFFKEAHIVHWPEWTHAGVGVTMFAAAAWLIVALAHHLQPRPRVA